MRRRVSTAWAVAALSAAALTAVTGGASADVGVPTPSASPLPTTGVTPPSVLPSPTTTPDPTPTGPSSPTSSAPSSPAGSGSGQPVPGTGSAASSAGSASATPDAGTARSAAGQRPAGRNGTNHTVTKDRAGREPVRPMIAGRPEAADVFDNESSPALARASKAFLAADQRIAELAKLRDEMTAAKTNATRLAQEYRALQIDAASMTEQATVLHTKSDRLRRLMVDDARVSYQTGRPVTSDQDARDLAAAAARADDAASQAEMRLGVILTDQARVKADFERFAARYEQARKRLDDINRRLDVLARQRSAALSAAEAAQAGDLAQHRQTLEESGALGAQIRAASAQLAASGRTVTGTGSFVRPSSGVVTSGYGMRYHPILHYVKLHTGTDFAVGDGFAHAADDGRVLLTVTSQAYGNFTVIDHGVIDGRHITTAYAHQARFLVKPGDVVSKGQRIGIVGATGFATGPHLHFEVRDDGAVQNPMLWLAR